MGESTKTVRSMIPDRLRIDQDGSATLLGTRCEDCASAFLGSVQFCRRCTSDNVVETSLSSTGTIASYTVVIRAAADWGGPVPYALAEVDLPDGVRVDARLSDWQEGDEITIGETVRVVADEVKDDDDGNGLAVYAWQRAGEQSDG